MEIIIKKDKRFLPQLAYCNLLKSHMDGLKRQKKVKGKTKAV